MPKNVKRGKPEKEENPVKSRRIKDLGDPRGSRQPEDNKIRTTDVEEQGDKKRPFKRRGHPK